MFQNVRIYAYEIFPMNIGSLCEIMTNPRAWLDKLNPLSLSHWCGFDSLQTTSNAPTSCRGQHCPNVTCYQMLCQHTQSESYCHIINALRVLSMKNTLLSVLFQLTRKKRWIIWSFNGWFRGASHQHSGQWNMRPFGAWAESLSSPLLSSHHFFDSWSCYSPGLCSCL